MGVEHLLVAKFTRGLDGFGHRGGRRLHVEDVAHEILRGGVHYEGTVSGRGASLVDGGHPLDISADSEAGQVADPALGDLVAVDFVDGDGRRGDGHVGEDPSLGTNLGGEMIIGQGVRYLGDEPVDSLVEDLDPRRLRDLGDAEEVTPDDLLRLFDGSRKILRG